MLTLAHPLTRRELPTTRPRRQSRSPRHHRHRGHDGLTLAEIARRLGVSSPALYRYFDGRQGLIQALYEDLTAELIDAVTQAAQRQEPDDISAQLHAASRAVLDWSVANRAEFSLLMGAANTTAAANGHGIPQVIPRELGGLFGERFMRLWRSGVLTPSSTT